MAMERELLVAVLAVVLVLVAAGRRWLFSSGEDGQKPPGPRSCWDLNPLGMLLFFATRKKGQLHEIFASWNQLYGKITNFRVAGTQFYVIADRDLGSKIFSHSYSKIFTTRGKNGIKLFIPQSLLGYEKTDANWKCHRSLIVGAFTESYLKKYFSAIVRIGQSSCDQMQRSPIEGDANLTLGDDSTAMYVYTKDHETMNIVVPDIVDHFNKVTYEVLANTVLGSEWMSIMTSFGTKEESSAALATAEFLSPIPEVLWNIVPFPSKKLAMTAFARVRECALQQIRQIRETGIDGESMMHFLVHHSQGLSDDEVVDELICLVMAGHETTANTLSFCLTSLAYNPDIQMKARREVKQALHTCDEKFTYDILKKLPYLWQIFRETLRLFPTVPFNTRIADDNTKLGGYAIPKGSRILVNNRAICRSADYYEDPLSFRPERWDNKEDLSQDKHLTNLKNFNDTRNFGGGQRMCVGKRFAEEEFVLLLAIILVRFSVSLTKLQDEEKRVPLLEIPTLAQITMTFAEPFPLIFQPL